MNMREMMCCVIFLLLIRTNNSVGMYDLCHYKLFVQDSVHHELYHCTLNMRKYVANSDLQVVHTT